MTMTFPVPRHNVSSLSVLRALTGPFPSLGATGVGFGPAVFIRRALIPGIIFPHSLLNACKQSGNDSVQSLQTSALPLLMQFSTGKAEACSTNHGKMLQ